MTTKLKKMLDSIVKEVLKDRASETAAARTMKYDARKARKDLEDLGWLRVIPGPAVPDGISSAEVLKETPAPVIKEPEPKSERLEKIEALKNEIERLEENW